MDKIIKRKVSAGRSRSIQSKYKYRTQIFYQKHGGKIIIPVRFIPLISVFAPFVAGVSKMSYFRFLLFNIISGIIRIIFFIRLGYLIGTYRSLRITFNCNLSHHINFYISICTGIFVKYLF